MKILAINGSPRGAAGNTDVLVQAFLTGAREAGAETETLYLKGKTIHHCLGCFTCWTKTPGVCVHKDDMPDIIQRMTGSDLMVYAMPLYVYTVPGLMKDFMDRLIPFAHPAIEKRGEHYIHPPRYGGGLRRTVLISNAGFPEMHHFDGLKRTFELMTDGPDSELSGVICCGAGPMLHIPGLENEVSWYLEAARKAGREVVEQGRISAETQSILDKPLAPDPAAYAEMTNVYWESLGVEMPGQTAAAPAEDAGEGTPLEPPASLATIRDLIAGMPTVFQPDAAGDLEAVIGFDVTDEEPGDYYLTIEEGVCRAFAGRHPSPTMTIHTPAEVWMKISRGEMDGAVAFMTREYKVSGKVDLLMRLAKLFKRKKA